MDAERRASPCVPRLPLDRLSSPLQPELRNGGGISLPRVPLDKLQGNGHVAATPGMGPGTLWHQALSGREPLSFWSSSMGSQSFATEWQQQGLSRASLSQTQGHSTTSVSMARRSKNTRSSGGSISRSSRGIMQRVEKVEPSMPTLGEDFQPLDFSSLKYSSRSPALTDPISARSCDAPTSTQQFSGGATARDSSRRDLKVLHQGYFGSYLVATDCSCRCARKSLSLVLLVGSVCCLYFARVDRRKSEVVPSEVELSEFMASIISFSLCAGAVLLLAFSMALFLGLGIPESVDISKVDEDWSISLRRRGLGPCSRPIKDFDAFVETFQCCAYFRLFCWKRRVGFTTSSGGTTHLFFRAGAIGPAICMSASLREPLAFFTRLRDVLSATSHPMSALVDEYVVDWE